MQRKIESMEKDLFYIEPSAIHFSDKSQDRLISAFLDEFEELLRIMAQGKHRFVIDSVLGKRIIEETGESFIPVRISDIKDTKLRGRVSRLKQTFYAVVQPMAVYVDTGACSVTSENFCLYPEADRHLLGETDYYDFFHSLAGECYRESPKSGCIISLPSYTKFSDKIISISCKCENSAFDMEFQCVVSDTVKDEKREAREKLAKLIGELKHGSESGIIVTQAVHHPSVGRTTIKEYKEIPRRSRMVLDILLKFGLYKLEIRDWGSHNGIKGDIHNCFRIDEKSDDSHEILEGWLISDHMSCKLSMYFHKNAGSLLLCIMGNQFLYNNMLDLKNDIF